MSENSLELLGMQPSDVLGREVDELVGADRLPALRAAASGSNPTEVVIGGRVFDAIVNRDTAITFVEFEPRDALDARDAESAAYAAAHRLSTLTSRQAVLEQIAVEYRAVTGFDRVMVYDFHPDGHGEVVAESRVEEMEPYLGLHFPASDIPVQARALYLTKLSRAITTTVTPPVPLLASDGVAAQALDLTHAELRAVSPFHLQFMRNMGQASTLSFSLIHRGELIGMITCAHRTERRLPFLTRRSLEVVANQVGLQLGSMRQVAELERRMRSQELRASLLAKIVTSDDLAWSMVTGDLTVLDVIAADAVAVRLHGTVNRTTGAPDARTIDRLLDQVPAGDSVLATDSLGIELPELAAELPGFAGVLVVRVGDGSDFIAFLRREVTQTIDWLGDLNEQNRSAVLSPRLSFSAWRESVTGRSLPWGELVDDAGQLAREVESALFRREQSRLASLALHDPLTGLPNRRYLTEQLARLAGIESEVSLLFIDLDDFKAINDTHGHDAGDAVLVEISRRLVENTRADDRVARLGGDEFVVLCESTPLEDAQALATRITEATRLPIGPLGHALTGSIGIVSFREATNPLEMLERADAAMYRAKGSGKDRVST